MWQGKGETLCPESSSKLQDISWQRREPMGKHQSKQFTCKSSKPVTGQYLDGLASRIQMNSLPFLTLLSAQLLMVPVLPRCFSSTMEKPTKRLKEFIFQVYLT